MDSSIVGHWTSFEMVRFADFVDILNAKSSLLGPGVFGIFTPSFVCHRIFEYLGVG